MNGFDIIIGIVGLVAGLLLMYSLKDRLASNKLKNAEADAVGLVKDAELRAETLLKEAELEAKDRLLKMKSDFDAETHETKTELKKQERRIIKKTELLETKQEQFENREREILRSEKNLDKRDNELALAEKKCAAQIEEQKKQLEKISGLTSEKAKDLLIRAM